MKSFLSDERGAIAAMAALLIGLIGAMSGAAIEVRLMTLAKQDAQNALDQAVLSAARTVSDYRGHHLQDDQLTDNSHRSLTGQIEQVGADAFSALLDNPTLETVATSFKLSPSDEVDAIAYVKYKPFLLNIFGVDAIEIAKEASAAPGKSNGAPACFTTYLNGINVVPTATLDAPECGLASSAEIALNGASTAALSCESGTCTISDPFAPLLAAWDEFQQGCNGTPAAGWTEQIDYGPSRFCDEVIVESGQTLHLMGGDFFFERGLTIRSGGRVDATGNGGSAVIIGQNALLTVEQGAIFTIKPYATGQFPGMSLIHKGTGFVSHFDIGLGAPGYVHMEGIVYAPAADIFFGGSGQVVVGSDGLAIWSESVSVLDTVTLPGAPTSVGSGLPMMYLPGSSKPRIVR